MSLVPPADALMRRFDALLFDLDGVVYVGPEVVPYAAESIAAARGAGVRCGFVTNNAARPARSVAEHLIELDVPAETDDVITSPQAAVALLPRYVPVGSRILVIGGAGIEEALVAAGYQPVRTLGDQPAAVMQGYHPDLSWRDLAEATFAVRAGLPWISTNPDLTFPTPRGVAPGNGSMVRIVGQTAGREPDAVAGKPEPPLLQAAIGRFSAERPLMVGDRLDTDIAAGSRVGIPSLLVFTGVTTLRELLAAIPEERPDFLGEDLRVLLHPYPEVAVSVGESGAWATCAAAVVRAGHRGALILDSFEPAGSWDAVRAAAALAWRLADEGISVDPEALVAQLEPFLTGTV